MALIKCQECGKEISDKAEVCPHCGNPINQEAQTINATEKTTKKSSKNVKAIIAVVAIVAIAGGIFISQNVLFGKDKGAFDLIMKYSSTFKNPSSIQLISGTYLYSKLGEGNELDMLNCKISATNGFGGRTSKYYFMSSQLGITSFDTIDDSKSYDDTTQLNIKKINKKLRSTLGY